MSDPAEPLTFRFEDFLLDKPAHQLSRLGPNGQMTKVQLGTRAFRILCLLVERRGGIVTRQEMMDAVWPNVVVEENNLAVQLSNLRRTLDVNRDVGSCIQTLPGRGYRLLSSVIPADNGRPVASEPAAAEVDAATSEAVSGAAEEPIIQQIADRRPKTRSLFASLSRRGAVAWPGSRAYAAVSRC